MKTTMLRNGESGAALMTVLVATLLLGTACIALLSAVGASARNNTDALSEAKAYWAAESGLQKTIDLLRHGGVTYAQANSDQDLSTWLGTGPVVVSSEASYTVEVRDPDNTANSTTFGVTGLFEQPDGSYAASRTFTVGADTTTISYEGVSNILVTHPMASGTSVSFGRFRVESTAAAVPAANLDVEFKLIYSLSAPLSGSRTIRGVITDGVITFTSSIPEFRGSTITICGGLGCPTNQIPGLLPSTTGAYTPTVNGRMTPIEPVRLLVRATGYGPNSSNKILEGVIQKSFLNGLGADNAITFLGNGTCIDFQLGNSAQLDINGGQSPSIGVPSSSTLVPVNTEINANNTNGTITPPPEVYVQSELPDWQQSPAAMDTVVRQLRQTAQNSGRYFPTNNVSGGWGDFATGTGITFCEGNCTMGGNASGGGILVVTGTFTTTGVPSFKGLVLVTGAGGVLRNGGGNENFLGTTIIAPYNPNDLAAGWGCPIYNQNGGPGNTVYQGLDATFDGTEAISNFMIGVAEK